MGFLGQGGSGGEGGGVVGGNKQVLWHGSLRGSLNAMVISWFIFSQTKYSFSRYFAFQQRNVSILLLQFLEQNAKLLVSFKEFHNININYFISKYYVFILMLYSHLFRQSFPKIS